MKKLSNFTKFKKENLTHIFLYYLKKIICSDSLGFDKLLVILPDLFILSKFQSLISAQNKGLGIFYSTENKEVTILIKIEIPRSSICDLLNIASDKHFAVYSEFL